MEESGEMNDINYLLQLEAYKRFKEDDNHIRTFVEEKVRQYSEVRHEYLNLYSRYVDVVKSSACRNALQSEKAAAALQGSDQTEQSIDTIARETNIDKQDEFFNTDAIALTKKVVNEAPMFDNLVVLNYSSENNKNRVDFIQSSLARVERKLESSIISGFESFLSKIEI